MLMSNLADLFRIIYRIVATVLGCLPGLEFKIQLSKYMEAVSVIGSQPGARKFVSRGYQSFTVIGLMARVHMTYFSDSQNLFFIFFRALRSHLAT